MSRFFSVGVAAIVAAASFAALTSSASAFQYRADWDRPHAEQRFDGPGDWWRWHHRHHREEQRFIYVQPHVEYLPPPPPPPRVYYDNGYSDEPHYLK